MLTKYVPVGRPGVVGASVVVVVAVVLGIKELPSNNQGGCKSCSRGLFKYFFRESVSNVGAENSHLGLEHDFKSKERSLIWGLMTATCIELLTWVNLL